MQMQRRGPVPNFCIKINVTIDTTRIHSSRMHSARSLRYRGLCPEGRGLPDREPRGQKFPLDRDSPQQRLPWTEVPPDRDPPPTGQRHSRQREPPGTDPLDINLLDRDLSGQRCPWTETPLDRDQDPPLPCGQTDTCVNICRLRLHAVMI